MPVENTTPTESVSWLQHRLHLAARRHLLIETATFAITVLSATLFALGLYFIADFLVRFPSFVRILLTLGLGGAGGFGAARTARRWIIPFRNLDDTAHAVQRADELAGRKTHSITVSALEFGERPSIPGSSELKNTVIDAARTQPNDPAKARLYSAAHFQIAKHALPVALIVAVLMFFAGPRTTVFLKRIIGFSTPYPSATCIALVDWQQVAPARVDYPVSVTVTGRIPSFATMTITPKKIRSYTLPMTVQSNGTFSAILQAPEESFSFSCTLGDATVGPLPVSIRKPPYVTNVVVSIKAPPYTAIPPRQDDNPTISVPEASELTFTIAVDLPIDSCLLTGEGRLTPCTATAQGWWTANVTVTNSWSYTVAMTSADKLTHTDPSTRRIIVTPDNAPTVEMRAPKPNSVIAPNSLLVFDIIAHDDYALKDISVNYQVFERRNDNDVRVNQGKFTVSSSNTMSRDATIHLIKPVIDLDLSAGQRVVFTGYASDNRQPKAQTGESGQTPVTIVSPEELRRILDAQLRQHGDLIQKISDDERRQTELLRQRLTNKEKP